jgi:Bacteriophage HK97-gp10, putative tail-component
MRVEVRSDRLDESERRYMLEFWDTLHDAAVSITQARIQAYSPVDTGRLRASWQSRRVGSEVEIYTDVEYAEYVEFGHRIGHTERYLPGQFTTRRAYEHTWQNIEPYMAARLKRLV